VRALRIADETIAHWQAFAEAEFETRESHEPFGSPEPG
jgi:hypothetical protein